MKILIVDDNPGVRRLLRRAVEPITSQVSECGDGSEALATYSKGWPDVVLMDVRMPQMDGLQATKQIRQFYPTARIVIVTDYDDEDLRQAASEAGACGYSLKQNLTDLPQLILSLFSKEQ